MKKFKTITDIGKQYRFYDKRLLVGDEEGLLFTNYQQATEKVAERLFHTLGDVPILELCCGIGGMTVFLAHYFNKIYAVDLDPLRIKAAKVNAKTFEVANKITFIIGDALDKYILKQAKKDGVMAVITDVEWRAHKNKKYNNHTSDIAKTIPSSVALFKIINKFISSNIVMHMPLESKQEQIRQLGDCEIELVKTKEKPLFLNVYFGSLKIANASELMI